MKAREQKVDMIFSLSSIATRATVFVCALLLSGCIELVPQHVEQTVSIGQDGRIDVVYRGQFQGLAEFVKTIAEIKKDKLPDLEMHRRSMLNGLKNKPGFDEVREVEPDIYHFRWRESSVLKSDAIPGMLSLYSGDDKIPRLLALNQIRKLSDNAFLLENIEHTDFGQDGTPDDVRLTRVIEGYAKRFKGAIRVDIASEMVLKHNAPSIKHIPGGRLQLEWVLTFPISQDAVKLAFTLDKKDFPTFKLMDAPPGSSCIELIGSRCKCGPFKIEDHRGNVQAYIPYEMHSPTGIFKGCTDANGYTVKKESEVTGRCVVNLSPEKDDKKKCSVQNLSTETASQ